jgi:hypothetical protein
VDTLIDRLPGFPDGVSRAEDGSFWVSIPITTTTMRTAAQHLHSRLPNEHCS